MQIRDRLLLEGEEYPISTISLKESPWLDVKRYISSVKRFSACWRGYYSKWEIRGDHLILVDLTIMWSGRSESLEFSEIFPDCPEGVLADWYSGEIEVPQGEELDLGHNYSMYQETLVLSFSRGVLTGRHLRDNRKEAEDEAKRIEGEYSSIRQAVSESKSNKPVEDEDIPETEIEVKCGDFMIEAMMGTVDEDVRVRWVSFYEAAVDSATANEKLLLEVVNNVLVKPKS